MKILFATSNRNKIKEVQAILGDDFEIICLKDLNDESDVEESGKTFQENAYIKAKYYFDKYHLDVVSDDSGLCCEALNGEPGVFSARYSGNGDKKNIEKLLRNLNNENNRNAFFCCELCYIDSSGAVHYFEGKINGKIIDSPRGNNGFGYDPVFYVPSLNKTFAEASSEEKNSMSHRSQALGKFCEFLNKNLYNI